MALETENVVTEVSTNMKISRGEKPDPESDILLLSKVEDLEVFDEDGKTIRFGDLYEKQKTIIVFIRNFLCFMAKEYVDDLTLIPEKNLKEAGVRLIIIGCAPYKFIKDFKWSTGYKGELYCDTERLIYKGLGCHETYTNGNTKSSHHVKSGFFMGTMKSAWRGMRYRQFQGDLNQQGGAFIIGPGNSISYYHRDILPQDHTPINQLLGVASVEQVAYKKDPPVIKI